MDIMYQLTNDQRRCLGLEPICGEWTLTELKPSRYRSCTSYAYIVNGIVRKFISVSENSYLECSVNERLSEDGMYILPKTDSGKLVKLSASTLEKKPAQGMAISYSDNLLILYNASSEQDMYISSVNGVTLSGIGDFKTWVEKWCADTTERDVCEITEFAKRKKVRQTYREGDFFRFRYDRRNWGYGRILISYPEMKSKKQEYWRCYMGPTLIVAVYRLLTDRPIDDIEFIASHKCMPSQPIMDNIFLYGTAEIIGNRPVMPSEADYPVNYGRSFDMREDILYLQVGKFLKKKVGGALLFPHRTFTFGYSGFHIRSRLPVLCACIEANSNAPYWEQEGFRAFTEGDLRNPKFKKEREEIFAQFGLSQDELPQGCRL